MYLELGRERDGDLSLYVLDAEGRRLSVAGVRGATAVVRHSATESVEVAFFPIGPGLVGPLQARWTSFTATVTVPYDGTVLTAEFTVGDGRSGGTR